MVTLDVIEPIELSDAQQKRHSNVLGRLQALSVGLSYLYGNVRNVELGVHARIRAEHGDCAFHWYSVSVVSFVRAASSIAFGDDKPSRELYQNKVLGNVTAFRDKVGAHLGGMTVNQRDNDAERLASLIPGVSWSGAGFVAGEWGIYMRRGNDTSDSKAIGPWRLTQTHEELSKRYPLLAPLPPTTTGSQE